MRKGIVLIVVVLALAVMATPAMAEPPSSVPGFAVNWWPLVEDGTYYLNCTPAQGTTWFSGVEPKMTPSHIVFFDLGSKGLFVWQGQEFYYDAALTEPALHAPDFDLWYSNPGKAANAWMTGKITTSYGNPPAPDPSVEYIYFKLYGVWTPTKTAK